MQTTVHNQQLPKPHQASRRLFVCAAASQTDPCLTTSVCCYTVFGANTLPHMPRASGPTQNSSLVSCCTADPQPFDAPQLTQAANATNTASRPCTATTTLKPQLQKLVLLYTRKSQYGTNGLWRLSCTGLPFSKKLCCCKTLRNQSAEHTCSRMRAPLTDAAATVPAPGRNVHSSHIHMRSREHKTVSRSTLHPEQQTVLFS